MGEKIITKSGTNDDALKVAKKIIEENNLEKKGINKKIVLLIIFLILIVALVSLYLVLDNKDKVEIAAIKTKLTNSVLLKEEIVEYGDTLRVLDVVLKDQDGNEKKIVGNNRKLLLNDEDITTYTFDTVGKVVFVEKIEEEFTTFLGKKEMIEVDNEITYLVRDTKAPIIEGVTDKVITQGEEIDLKAGITAKDEVDGELDFTIDGEVNTNEPGEYKIVVKAVDKNGLETIKEFTVRVEQKQVTKKKININTNNSSSKTVKSNISNNNDNKSSKNMSWEVELNGNTGKIIGSDNTWEGYETIELTPEQVKQLNNDLNKK